MLCPLSSFQPIASYSSQSLEAQLAITFCQNYHFISCQKNLNVSYSVALYLYPMVYLGIDSVGLAAIG